MRILKPRLPLEEFDPNSQDSGYGGSCSSFSDEKTQKTHEPKSSKLGFQFAEPMKVAPRKLSLEMRSPMKSPMRISPQQSRKRPALFRSVSSGYESTDDGFNDLIDMESLENECSLPNGLSSLISGNIVNETTNNNSTTTTQLIPISTTPEATTPGCRPRLTVRRSLSQQIESACSPDDNSNDKKRTPEFTVPRARSCLFRSPNASCSTTKLSFACESLRIRPELGIASPPPTVNRKFKRPEPPSDLSPQRLFKRSRKATSFQEVSFKELKKISPVVTASTALQRSLSETEADMHIKQAIVRSTTENDLTGDFSKPCVLPLADGQHEDLKAISAETLSKLMRGDFADCVSDFRIVDCRYPYEFKAGHIVGAHNLYTKEMIEEFLINPLVNAAPLIEPNSTSKRSILVFHCEFSWERGPNLSRFLRNIDRKRNKEHYPALHYPEIYLLHGGYQMFFKEQRSLCSPQGYLPMRDPKHEADLKQFRSKSKSWQGEKAGTRPNVVTARANLKRLGF